MARDNGIPAAANYQALLDVAEGVTHHVFTALAAADIAAYAQPFVGREPSVAPFADPPQRIWVDRSKWAQAQVVITTELPGLPVAFLPAAPVSFDLPAARIDEQFADIASRLSAQGLGTPTAPPATPEPPFEPEPGYQPPIPPALPRATDRLSRSAWLGVILGPAVAVLSVIFGAPGWLAGLGLSAFAAGFVVLVARMPARGRRGEDGGQGWDDGAVI